MCAPCMLDPIDPFEGDDANLDPFDPEEEKSAESD